MTPDTVIGIGQQALLVTAMLAAPLLLSALGAGLIVGMFQAATQINEMTLSFIPKLLVLVVAMYLSGRWMLNLIMGYSHTLITSIPTLIG
jgi:flagellar biosynthetic protein FliQ